MLTWRVRIAPRTLGVLWIAALVVGACSSDRVSGTPVDTTGTRPSGQFPILVTPQLDNAFSAASDGVNFLVATYSGTRQLGTVGAQLISTSSTIGAPIRLGQSLADVPAVGFGGGKYLVLYANVGADSLEDIFAQFVTPGGATLGAPIKLSTVRGYYGAWSVAYGNGTFLCAYALYATDTSGNTPPTVRARSVTSSGALGPELLINSRGFLAAVAFDGARFAVGFVHGGPAVQRQTLVRFVNTSGTLAEEVALSSTGQPPNNGFQVGLGFNGSRYLMAWGDRNVGDTVFYTSSVVYAQAFLPSGAPVGTLQTIPMPQGSGRVASVTASGDLFVLATHEGPGGAFRTMVRFFDGSGSPRGGAQTAFAPDSRFSSVLGYPFTLSPGRFLFLLNERGAGADSLRHVYGAVVSLSP